MSKSGPGGPDKDTSGFGKSVLCPTCGRDDFTSNRGMRMHHARKHGESLSTVTVTCLYCGNELERQRCVVGERNFCDQDCLHVWQSENRVGENHHQYNRVEVECEICGKFIKKKPSQIRTYDHSFCSIGCHREYQSIHQVGENHHNYEGGRSKEYGPNWLRQRRKRIEKDNETCQMCGVERSELDRDLHVHHIVRRREFMTSDGFDYEKANRLDNLITLCSKCHKRVEQWNLRPDTR